MISIEAEKYRGDFWLLIRQWDGYDQPHRSRIFKITEEEVKFEGGRFKRMMHMYDAKQATFQKLIIDYEDHKIEGMINWLSENTASFWSFDISVELDDCIHNGDVHEVVWVFRFKDESDAMAFKLRWM